MQGGAVERSWRAPEVASDDEASAVLPEGGYGTQDATLGGALVEERPEAYGSEWEPYEQDRVGPDAYGEGADGQAWGYLTAGGVAERLPQPAYLPTEYGYEEVEGYEPYGVAGEQEDDEDEEYELDFGPSAIEEPRRRGFYHHSSSDDHHHLRRRRQRDGDPEQIHAFGHATAALTAFAGLALFVILLLTIAIVAGAAAIIQLDQQQPPVETPPVHVPQSKPAPRLPKPVVPPILPVVPVEPVPPVVPVVPPELPPPVVIPPGKKQPPTRPGPKGPARGRPPRGPGKTGPGRQNPKPRPKPKNPLPYCENVKVYVGDGIELPIQVVEGGMDPDRNGVPGICRPDPGAVGVSTLSKTSPSTSGPVQATLTAKVTPDASADGAVSPSSSSGQQPKASLPSAGSASAPSVVLASAGGSSGAGLLTSGQEVFGARLVADTGLNEQVVIAWMLAEVSGGNTPGSPAWERQQANNNDWLNIGYTGSGNFGTGDSVWSSPVTAADATAGWMKGETIPGFGPASSSSTVCGISTGIRGILAAVGQPPRAQIVTLQHSGWATSCYGVAHPPSRCGRSECPNLPLDYELVTGVTLPSVGAGEALSTSSTGGSLTLAELQSRLPTVTQADLSHLTTRDLENALPQLEAALDGQTTGETLPAGVGPAGAQRMLAAAQAVLGAGYNQGNHDAVSDSPAEIKQLGTDCSGFVSYLMGPNGADLWSQSYTTVTMSTAPNIERGEGTYVTIHNNPLPGNSGHVFIEIEGEWFEDAGGIGLHQMSSAEVQSYLQSGLYTQNFHPTGM